LRIHYDAPASCRAAEAFLDEVRARTSLARVARPDEAAIELSVRIVRRGAASQGHLTLGEGSFRVDRRIEGASCDEVVSALALVTALALDPNASLSPTPSRNAPDAPDAPDPPLAPSPPPAPPVAPKTVAPAPVVQPVAPAPVGPPVAPPPGAARPARSAPTALPVPEVPAPKAPPWVVGARAVVDVAAAPRALVGGGAFAERPFAASWRPSIRLAADVAGTGDFTAGPGGVWFLQALVRVQGCGFAVRLGGVASAASVASIASIAPCLELQGGLLHAEGELQGSLQFVRRTTTGWFAGGVVPRFDVDVGPVVVDLQGGPIFPAVRQTFFFTTPSYTIGSVSAVTWTVALGLGGRFP
jgi:hypothetical protein